MNAKTIIFLIIIVLYSCKRTNNATLSDIIDKFDNVDISLFDNKFIAIRDDNYIYTTYIINIANDNEWPYFVKYNKLTKKISKKWKYGPNKHNFTDKEINEMIEHFNKLNIYLLSVDNNKNILLNPYSKNSPPSLLRVNNFQGKDTIRKGFIFKHYKKNWYIKI